jgi:hypothetical protein
VALLQAERSRVDALAGAPLDLETLKEDQAYATAGVQLGSE